MTIKLGDLGQAIDTDVLVLGSGAAGCGLLNNRLYWMKVS